MTLAKALAAAAGNAGEAVYIEDTFSTYLYTGNGTSQTITNGIDLAGEGGLVWIKQRSSTQPHYLNDTVRGATKFLSSNTTDAEGTEVQGLTSFSSSGFSVGSRDEVNGSTQTYASWTFRKAEKFFDVVTYTGNGVSGRQIAHNLGSVPGVMIVKSVSTTGQWPVYHRSTSGTPQNDYLLLNQTAGAYINQDQIWNNTAPTSTVFTVGSNTAVNANGVTYVAYLFAHDAGGFGADGSENVISCGSFTGNTTVNLGYEPQWVLIKASSTTGNWQIIDNMRKWVGTDAASSSAEGGAFLAPNLANAESNTTYNTNITPTGFKVDGISGTHIYIAIRRPMKPPESGTEVFGLQNNPTSSSAPAWVTSFPVDFSLVGRTSTWDGYASSRLAGQAYLQTNSTAAETSSSNMTFDYSNGFGTTAFSSSGFMGYMFKRAPGFMDVVCYTGTGVARTVAHNLTVAPELMIVKCRSTARAWPVYVAPIGNTNELRLNETSGSGSTSVWNSTTPTSSVFSLGTPSLGNFSGDTYVAYLFATYPGVSKVFSYTGNGSSQTINCGFTGGARFVLIKRTDSAGDWYVWDTARGMVAGNDPHLSLNTTAAEVTTDDSVDTAASGFIVNQVAATNVNVNSATYIGLAIA